MVGDDNDLIKITKIPYKVIGGALTRDNYIYTGEDFSQLIELACINGMITIYNQESISHQKKKLKSVEGFGYNRDSSRLIFKV